ncbi:MAG: hypothetical protein AseanaTS_24250 [Candidatus Pelagadaptatus aseana]|uniref:DUF6763 family protein n=1 Tax=Candidatus Pelagadaptatus aseana TaxID=3120508 RepID=UPI0039B358A4
MGSSQPPLIGNWYYDPMEDQYFEVVAMDTDNGTIEIQYVDGEVGELDRELWKQMHPSTAPPPKSADAAFELANEDHLHDYLDSPEPWTNPVHQIEPDLYTGYDDF